MAHQPSSREDKKMGGIQVIARAAQILNALGEQPGGMILAGEATDTIIAQSLQLKASMIIMGRRHLSSFNLLLKGSVSAAVIERAHCPVLLDVRKDLCASMTSLLVITLAAFALLAVIIIVLINTTRLRWWQGLILFCCR